MEANKKLRRSKGELLLKQKEGGKGEALNSIEVDCVGFGLSSVAVFASGTTDLLDVGEFVDGEVLVFFFFQHFVTHSLGTEVAFFVDVKIDFATTEEVLEVEQGGVDILFHVLCVLDVFVHEGQHPVNDFVGTEIVAVDKAVHVFLGELHVVIFADDFQIEIGIGVEMQLHVAEANDETEFAESFALLGRQVDVVVVHVVEDVCEVVDGFVVTLVGIESATAIDVIAYVGHGCIDEELLFFRQFMVFVLLCLVDGIVPDEFVFLAVLLFIHFVHCHDEGEVCEGRASRKDNAIGIEGWWEEDGCDSDVGCDFVVVLYVEMYLYLAWLCLGVVRVVEIDVVVHVGWVGFQVPVADGRHVEFELHFFIADYLEIDVVDVVEGKAEGEHIVDAERGSHVSANLEGFGLVADFLLVDEVIDATQIHLVHVCIGVLLLAFHFFEAVDEIASQGKLAVHHGFEEIVEIGAAVEERDGRKDVDGELVQCLVEGVDVLGDIAGVVEFVADNAQGIQSVGRLAMNVGKLDGS